MTSNNIPQEDANASHNASVNSSSITIDKGTDLNEIGQPSQWDMGQLDNRKVLPDEVFDNLPDLLREPCEMLTNPNDREVFLVGALGTVSGVLPNLYGFYRGSFTGPNLFCYILAPFGVGKGALENSKKLVQPIHREKRKQFEDETGEYRINKSLYEKAIKAYQRDKKGEDEPPVEPVRPPNHMLFIPANNSKTGVFQLLSENSGRGIIYETEGDTLADALKQDFGNFSDGLRKAFHHESVSYFRRTESEYVEIEKPYVSVILSSTYGQLLKLIPSPENGLFSRFIYYELQPSSEFDNVFDSRKAIYDERFAEWGDRLRRIHNALVTSEVTHSFRLQSHQQDKFIEFFRQEKQDMFELVGKETEGIVNRLAIICFRIAMILSALRELEKWSYSKHIICSDQDFENALRIIEVFKLHTLSLYWKMTTPKDEDGQPKPQEEPKPEQRKKCLELFEQKVSYRKIALQVLGDEGKKSTVYRWINQHK